MIYLASPYSHPSPVVRQARFDAACQAAAGLIRGGHFVFAPIVHGHPLTRFDLPGDWEYWERYNRRFLAQCEALVVLTLDGWRECSGVQAEIEIAADLGKTIRYGTLVDVAEVGHERSQPLES